MSVFEDRTFKGKKCVFGRRRWGCFSFTHVEVEVLVGYPQKSRLELEVQAKLLEPALGCSLRCSWVLVVPGSFGLNAMSQQECKVTREMKFYSWLAPSLRDGRGCNS